MIPGHHSLFFVTKYLFIQEEREVLGGDLGYFLYFVAEALAVWLGYFCEDSLMIL